MRKLLLSAFFVLITIVAVPAQQAIQGRVLEQSSRKPVPYANIGIPETSAGTISNADGSFSVPVPAGLLNDTLVFSALGYGIRRVPLSSIRKGETLTVLLPEKTSILQEVTVSAQREKKKSFWLGNRYHRGGFIYADSVAGGSAMALLIENKHPAHHPDLTFPVFVEKAKLKISSNTMDEFKVRVRFLEVDSVTKLPGKDLFNESLVVASGIKKGWLTFDLSSFDFKIDQQAFFLVFEWIMEDQARLDLLDQYHRYKKANPDKVTHDTMVVRGEKVTFHSYDNFKEGTSFGVSPIQFSLDHYTCYSRTNSFGEWKRAPVILTARLSVSNQASGKAIPFTAENPEQEAPCKENTSVCEATRLSGAFLGQGAVNGMQLTVSVKGKTVLSKGFGLSDVENNTAVSTLTRFRIGSVSKALTSAALIKLVSENKLDLDTAVQAYVAAYPPKRFTVTTRQLAGHLAGIRHYHKNELKDLIRTEHYASANEAVTIFKEDTLLFKPGERFLYSSYGWNLTGAVIEGASGQSYLDYMHNRIWKPLSMGQTYGDVADSAMEGRSRFYDATGEEAPHYDLSYKFPSGGLLSTTEDLVKFGNELLYGTYFNPALKKQLFETQYTDDKKPTNYGLGWNIGKDKNGHRIWFHAGSLPEGSAFLILYPDDDVVVAFLANSNAGLSFDIESIGALFYSKD